MAAEFARQLRLEQFPLHCSGILERNTNLLLFGEFAVEVEDFLVLLGHHFEVVHDLLHVLVVETQFGMRGPREERRVVQDEGSLLVGGEGEGGGELDVGTVAEHLVGHLLLAAVGELDFDCAGHSDPALHSDFAHFLLGNHGDLKRIGQMKLFTLEQQLPSILSSVQSQHFELIDRRLPTPH